MRARRYGAGLSDVLAFELVITSSSLIEMVTPKSVTSLQTLGLILAMMGEK